MPIKAVLFDMDGVLIDAREWHYMALNQALAVLGFTIDRYDHLVTYDGLPTKRKLELLSMECGLPRELHKFVMDLKQRYTLDLIYANCKPVFAHEFALSTLKNEGYQLVVCSNSIRASIEAMLGRAELIHYLDFYLSNEDVRAPKPDPEIYLTAINRLNLEPSECLIVEDNENGVKAAQASGAHLLRVRDPSEVRYEAIRAQIENCELAICA